jgi:hypothetical protein
VTQGDIRAIQLAKAALYAGAKLLMDEMGVETVDKRHSGRGFRRAYQPQARDGPGDDPRCEAGQGRVRRATPPAPGRGLRCATWRRATQIEATVHEIHKVETAIEPRFQEHFVNANAIPNASIPSRS